MNRSYPLAAARKEKSARQSIWQRTGISIAQVWILIIVVMSEQAQKIKKLLTTRLESEGTLKTLELEQTK